MSFYKIFRIFSMDIHLASTRKVDVQCIFNYYPTIVLFMNIKILKILTLRFKYGNMHLTPIFCITKICHKNIFLTDNFFSQYSLKSKMNHEYNKF